MVREVVTIQVGQCGNQVGWRFWDLVLREHVQHNRAGLFDESLSSFFRNVDTRHADPLEIPLGAGQPPISALRARSVLVDTEEGVVGQLMRGPLADLFDDRQVLTDVSGAGNNWAHGSAVYGPQHREASSSASAAPSASATRSSASASSTRWAAARAPGWAPTC